MFNDKDYFKHKLAKEVTETTAVSGVEDIRVIEGQQITDTNQDPAEIGEGEGRFGFFYGRGFRQI